VSHLLELLGRGLDHDLGRLLSRYYWSPQARSLEQLQQTCREQPDAPDLRLQLGLAHLRAMQLDDAVMHLQQACRTQPDFLAARTALAAAYEEKGDVAGALEQLRIANTAKPGETPILFAIAFCLEKLSQSEAAADYYRDVIAQDGSFTPARERLAAIAVNKGDTNAAIEQYKALRELLPQETWIRSALAHLYFRAGDFSMSVDEFQSAIAMEPENWALMDDEVEALVADGQIREAIDRLNQLIEQQGPFGDLYIRLADLYSQVGDDESAMKNYRAGLDLQPGSLEGLVKMGTHHLICGRWDEAAEAFCEAAERNDKLLVNYIGTGVAQAQAGRASAAMNSFDLAAALEPNSTLLLSEMARLQLKASVADEYLSGFRIDSDVLENGLDLNNEHLLQRQIERHAEEIQRHPSHADLRYRYGVLLRGEGRLVDAKEQFTKAVEINPTYVQALVKLGVTQQELGEVEESLNTFRNAIDIAPQHVEAHYRLGLLFTDRRQFEQAVKHMEAAAQGNPDNEQIRAGLALSLQNMGLMDRSAATWRSLWKLHHAGT
jgi:tetratricopeptide (TPR) repeat protein